MNPQEWEQVKLLFETALDKKPEERLRFLEENCGGDASLRDQVVSLLGRNDRAGSFLERPLLDQSGFPAQGPRPPAQNPALFSSALESGTAAGAVIGPYHLLELIGEGGMGEVWLAEQKHPVRRKIALKLIKTGMDTREVVGRFESERQALALMDHPAIARVFEAGSTQQGRPYFVMEYVAGIPITTYCDEHRLTTRERLELFVHACEGVQHAHQKAIIHRDLKPSNILVTEVDGKPVPKIIDFGVAKAISQRLTAETMLTRAGSILVTPNYMSPEQADSGGEDIDTRTDVYSLGVVLYELLVGALPLDLRKLSLDEMLRRLREEDTPRPSTKVRTLGEQSTISAQNRRTVPANLSRQLRGDLDAITLKALEKDRSRRYGTPSELGVDIGRYLRNEAVVARPTSFGYRARKYIRRHRIGVGVAGGLVLLLVSFAAMQAVQLRRTTRERDRADRIANFMTGMFKVSDPRESRGNKVTAREILDKASKDIGKGLANDRELQAQMMHVMGTVYFNLGLYSRAEELQRGAVEIRSRVLRSDDVDTLKSMSSLGATLHEEGHYAEAERLHRQVLETRRRVLGPDHSDTLHSINNLASSLEEQGRNAEAEKLLRQAVDIERRVLGPEHPDTLWAMDDLANSLANQGHYAESEKLRREEIDLHRRVLGPEHPETLQSMGNLGATLNLDHRFIEALRVDGELLEIERRVLGSEHVDTLRTMGGLASDLAHTGHYIEAGRLHGEALAILRRVVGPEHPETLHSMSALSSDLAHMGQ
jgi:serine/threonine protein kinase